MDEVFAVKRHFPGLIPFTISEFTDRENVVIPKGRFRGKLA